MIGIYKISNDLNNKIYIGQSTHIENRWKQHVYCALNPSRCNMTIDFEMGKLGVSHFKIEVIEECQVKDLDKREIYWISYFDSYKNGYNSTCGGKSLKGEDHPRAILNEEDVWSIRELYARHVPFRDAWEIYKNAGITKRGFQKIWRFDTWRHIHPDVYTNENLEWHKTFAVGHSKDQIGTSSLDRSIKQDEIDAMYKDYLEGMSVWQIAKKYNRDTGVVEKYMSHPKEVKEINYNGQKVQNIETELIFPSISKAAKWAKCGATTLTRHLYDGKPAGTNPETGEPAHWKKI